MHNIRIEYCSQLTVDYADLPIIDLSKSPRPDDVREAMQTHGFFYVVGHGLSPDEVWSMCQIIIFILERVLESTNL